MVCTLLFSPSKCSLFHNSNEFGSCIIHILYTGVLKFKKKNNSGAKSLNICLSNLLCVIQFYVTFHDSCQSLFSVASCLHTDYSLLFIEELVNAIVIFWVAVKHRYMKINGETKVKFHKVLPLTRRNEFQAAVNVLLREEPDGETPDEKVQSRFELRG